MKFPRSGAVTLILMLITASYSPAELRKPGITGAAFLKIGVGARMVALGSAATTIYGDPNAIFWNPAGIEINDGKTQLGFNYNDWIAELNYMSGVISHSFGNSGTFGVGFIYLGLSGIAADRDIAPVGYESEQFEPLGTGRFDPYDYSDMALVIAYSKQFTARFRMGVAGKYIRETIDDVIADAIAFDFGVVYETGFRNLTFGARLNNVGSDLRFYAFNSPLPLNFSIGASVSLAKEEKSDLKALVDFTKPQDSPQLFFTGLEWLVHDLFALRAGCKFGYSGAFDKKTRLGQTDEGLSFGAGLNLPISGYKLWLDYAFTSFTVFNDTHRFTLKFEL